MDIEDVKISIALQISDIQTLINFINVNKQYRHIYSQKHFWNNYLLNRKLYASNKSYDKVNDWINEFENINYIFLFSERVIRNISCSIIEIENNIDTIEEHKKLVFCSKTTDFFIGKN